MDRHQGKVTTSQLGWHPAEPHPMPPNSKENFIKNRGRGGLGQNPQNKTRNKAGKKNRRERQETTVYRTLERGNPLRSKKKSV